MGSRTIDFWLEFGNEFLVCAIEARWRFPQISTLICGCKNQQNIENQCFYGDTISHKTMHNRETRDFVWIRVVRFRESFGKVFNSTRGLEREKLKSNDNGEG